MWWLWQGAKRWKQLSTVAQCILLYLPMHSTALHCSAMKSVGINWRKWCSNHIPMVWCSMLWWYFYMQDSDVFPLYCSARTYCSPEDGSGSQMISLLTVAATSSILTILSTHIISHPYCVLCSSLKRVCATGFQKLFRSYGLWIFQKFYGVKNENRFIVHRNRVILGKVSETFPKFGEIWRNSDENFGDNLRNKRTRSGFRG